MKTKSVARSVCTGCLLGVPAGLLYNNMSSCDAFFLLNQHPHATISTQRHAAGTPKQSLVLKYNGSGGLLSREIYSDGTARHASRRTRSRDGGSVAALPAFSGPGEPASGPSTSAVPRGPGAGMIDLKFQALKPGGFKGFLLFFLIGVSVIIVADSDAAETHPSSAAVSPN